MYKFILVFICCTFGSIAQCDERETTVVFIPGIMGSKLVVNDNVVWGNLLEFSDDLEYSSGQNVNTEPLLELEALWGSFRKSVYGDIVSSLEDNLSEEIPLYPFSYDWRGSNVLAASKLNDEICNKNIAGNKKLILFAHSMGGLVLKHWLQDFRAKNCNGAFDIEIAGLVFAGTPHFGSPKAFQTFIENASLIDFPIRDVDRYISQMLNKVGASFDSIYELFPASHAYIDNAQNNCIPADRKDDTALKTRVWTVKADGTALNKKVDIFSEKILIRLGADKRLPPSQKGNAAEYLKNKLSSARINICKLMSFRIPDDLKGITYYVAGRQIEGTKSVSSLATKTNFYLSKRNDLAKSKYSISRSANTINKSGYYLYTEFGHGDGTVPLDVALAKIEVGSDKNRIVTGGHLALLNNVDLKFLVESFRESQLELPFRKAESYIIRDSSTFIDVFDKQIESSIQNGGGGIASLGAVINETEIFINNEWKIDDRLKLEALESLSATTVKVNPQEPLWVNSAIIAAMGGSVKNPNQFYEFVKDKDSSPAGWEVAGALSGLSPERTGHAVRNSAIGYADQGDLDYANNLYSKLLAKGELVSEWSNSTKASVYNSAGWVAYNRSDRDLAKNYFEKSIEALPEKEQAIWGLNTLSYQPFGPPPDVEDVISDLD